MLTTTTWRLKRRLLSLALVLAVALFAAACASDEIEETPEPIIRTPAATIGNTPAPTEAPPTVAPPPNTPAPAPTRPVTAPTRTASPTPFPAGTKLALENLQGAWSAAGYTITDEGQSAGFTGFSVQPREVKLARGTDEQELSVFIYPDSSGVKQEWDVTDLYAIAPAGNRVAPARRAVWWNENTIVVVRTRTEIGSTPALQAFLDLTP